MTRQTFAWLVMGAALWPGSAWANWEYTKWGMTPEQVQAAAKGKLSPATPQDACQSCGSAPLLAGDFTAAGQIFGLRFVFADGKALSAVVLATQSTGRTWGCNDLFNSLSQRYGAPAFRAPLTGDGTLPNSRWLDSRRGNTVSFIDASLQTGLCEVRYGPLNSGGL